MIDEKALIARLSDIYPVSEAVLQRLIVHVDRLREWQRKTNLVAPSTLDEVWERHIADSLQCVAIAPNARRWLDLGSGGGFPALVIAAVMADHDASEVVMVESIQKKCAFLRQVGRQAGSPTRVVCSRIEEYQHEGEKPEVVTARALTALNRLLDWSSPWLETGATGLFHKGREFQEELADCNGLWEFDLVHHESRIAPDSVILEIKNLKRKTG